MTYRRTLFLDFSSIARFPPEIIPEVLALISSGHDQRANGCTPCRYLRPDLKILTSRHEQQHRYRGVSSYDHHRQRPRHRRICWRDLVDSPRAQPSTLLLRSRVAVIRQPSSDSVMRLRAMSLSMSLNQIRLIHQPLRIHSHHACELRSHLAARVGGASLISSYFVDCV